MRSHSCSATRRPIAASSSERTAPVRCAAAWPMHPTPHWRVFATSHQCIASRSTVRPPAPSYAATSWSIVPSPPTSSGAPNRHAFTHNHPRSSRGSPTCTSSQSIAAASPSSSTITLPSRRSPCTIVVAVRAAGARASHVVGLVERRDCAVVEPLVRLSQYCQRCRCRLGARDLVGIDRVQSGEEVGRDRRRAPCARAAYSSSRRILPGEGLAVDVAPSRAPRCRAASPSSSTRTSGTRETRARARAHRVGLASHRAGQWPGRPGGSRRRMSGSAVRGERPRLAGRAAAQLPQISISTGAPERRVERGREPSDTDAGPDGDVIDDLVEILRQPRARAVRRRPAGHALGDARHHAVAPVAQRDVRPHVAVDLVHVVVGRDDDVAAWSGTTRRRSRT